MILKIDASGNVTPGIAGQPVRVNNQGFVTDVSGNRLKNATDALIVPNDHGQLAISIMAAAPNDGQGIAGINWSSTVLVESLYDGASQVNLATAIANAMAFAGTKDVVFQGGIQGEAWLTSTNDGQQSTLESILAQYSATALFAVAAGNGGLDINNLNPPNTSPGNFYLPGQGTSVSGGVARLASSSASYIAPGAPCRTRTSSPSPPWRSRHPIPNRVSPTLPGVSLPSPMRCRR